MDAREHLHQIIDERQGRLAAGVPPDREAALLALIGAVDRLPMGGDLVPNVLTDLTRPSLDVLGALRLCLAGEGSNEARGDLDTWADRFLAACGQLEAARLVARWAESGEMRLAVTAHGGVDAWPPGRSVPASSVERADIDAWARRHGPAQDADAAARVVDALMAWQAPYPTDAEIGGLPLATSRAVLASLLKRSAEPAEAGPLAVDETALIDALAGELGTGQAVVRRAVSALTLGPENVAWHAALPGGPQAPLVRIGPGRLALSRRGVRSEPVFFLLRELRRRDPEGYHNAARLREAAFRRDLYELFGDRRFVASEDRIVLRREGGQNRTDVDAAVFDRKTGTLALFELKSQDPLARTIDEAERQRASLRRAGSQVAAVLDWITRHGADEVLNRMDRATARRFRVQRVLPFVLGRYAVGDAARGGRVAWGTWPQVLQVMDRVGQANPLLTLHTRLRDDDRAELHPAADAAPVVIRLGEATLTVFGGREAVRAERDSSA